jgi:hypothetical protein
MIRLKILATLIPVLAIPALTIATLILPTVAVAEDTPPANSAPPSDDANRQHHDLEWVACKKQADDQKLAPGDARREFMKNCMKSAKSTAPSS